MFVIRDTGGLFPAGITALIGPGGELSWVLSLHWDSPQVVY